MFSLLDDIKAIEKIQLKTPNEVLSCPVNILHRGRKSKTLAAVTFRVQFKLLFVYSGTAFT